MTDDQFLYEFRTTPRSEFSASLYQRINTPPAPRLFTMHRLAWGWVLLVLGIGLLVWVSPPIRVFAQNLLTQIGHLFITDEPTYAEQYEIIVHLNTPVPTLDLDIPPLEWQPAVLLTKAEAENQAGFEVFELTGIPVELVMVMRMVTTPDARNPYTSVVTAYQSADQILTLKQIAYGADAEMQTLPVGESPVTAVSVQDGTGFWIENLRLSTYVDENNQVAPQYANLLVWEKGGFEFWLQSTPGLPLEAMLDWANNLQP